MNSRIWFYSRLSMQTDIEEEIREFRKWAVEHDGEMAGCTFEPTTSPLLQREGIREIVDAAEHKAIDLVVAESIDYFSQRRSELEPFLKRLFEDDVAVFTKRQGQIRLPEYD